MRQARILIAAGGTGGHVFPGLSVAKALLEQGSIVAWVGTVTGIESKLVPEANIPIYYISVKGLRGHGFRRWIMAPKFILKSFFEAVQILNQVSPDVVLTLGGYVAGPVGLAAFIKRIPVLVHEQNACFGLTNRLLKKIAVKVMVAFPDMGKNLKKYIETGNPIRNEIKALSLDTQEKSNTPLNILIIGGSLGAKVLNETVPKAIALLSQSSSPVCIWHQTGENHTKETQALYTQLGLSAKVTPFIQDISVAYQWADILIARAGALTLAEVTAVGLPSILVPYPYAVDDHQTSNATLLVKAGGAIMIPQSKLTAAYLSSVLLEFQTNFNFRLNMGRIAKQFAKPDATEAVARLCLEVFREKCI